MVCSINLRIIGPKHQAKLCCNQKESDLLDDIPGERSEANDP